MMNISTPRVVKCIIAASLLTAGLVGQRAAAQAARPAPTPVPVAPAAGIDASKMPDIEGIHLGMSPQDVFPRLKALFPQNTFGGTLATYVRYNQVPGSSWMSTADGNADPCAKNPACTDQISVTFSIPPDKQGAINVQRTVQFPRGKEPTAETVKAALLQKYGPNPFVINANYLGWIYDEQGAPLTPANGKTLVQCASNVREPEAGGPSPTNATAVGSIKSNAPLTQADIDDLMRDQCRVGVYVLANITVIGPIVTILQVKMSENSEDTRAVIASQQYLDRLAAGQQQQQIKNAQQQTAPKL